MPILPVKQNTERKFLGKTENFVDNDERLHEGKHLKAYLKGATRFKSWGIVKGVRKLIWYPVLEERNGVVMNNATQTMQDLYEINLEK